MNQQNSALAGRPDAPSRCIRCGEAFVCGMVAGLAVCWCAGLPASAPPDPSQAGCYCQKCLREVLAQVPVSEH